MNTQLLPLFRSIATLTLGLTIAALGSAKPTTHLQALPDSVRTVVEQSSVVGPPPASQTIYVAIGLQPSAPGALLDFADMVSDPKSPNYRHFATPEQIAANFGPDPADVNGVVSYLKSQGLKVTLVSRNHMGILAEGTVSKVQAAFGTQIKSYVGPDPTGKQFSFIANATSICVPQNLAKVILSVDGLDTYSRPHPRTTLNPTLARGLYNTAPSYGAGFTGAGCKIGFSNWDGFKISNAALYISAFGLPVPSGGSTSNIHVVSVQGSNNNRQGQGEGDLDLQMELSAAPLADIYVYDSTGGEYATILRESSDNTADIISESYGWGGPWNTSNYQSLHNAHVTMTAQGQTYLCASGDSGTSELSSYAYPDCDPEVTNVGGTIATVNTTTGARIGEVAWSGSTGGWSTSAFGTTNYNVHPSWQTGHGVPTSSYRLVPDIAMHSQSGNNAAFVIYYQGGQVTIAGTSCASPYCTSSLATLEQRLLANGQPRRMGRINDLIYSENGRSDVWFDIVSGSGNGTLPGGVSSVPTAGWDTVTGWGAPNFGAWYTALAIQTVVPTSFTMIEGIVNSGNVASLAAIDGNTLSITRQFPALLSQPPIQFTVDGTANLSSASNLELDVTAQGGVGITQIVEAYNWTTGTFQTVDTRATSTTQSTARITLASPNQFIQAGTNAVRARVSYRQTGGTAVSLWIVNVDQTAWKATPS